MIAAAFGILMCVVGAAQDPERQPEQQEHGNRVMELLLAGDEEALRAEVLRSPLRSSLMVHGLLREAAFRDGDAFRAPLEAAEKLASVLSGDGWQGAKRQVDHFRGLTAGDRLRWREIEALQERGFRAASEQDFVMASEWFRQAGVLARRIEAWTSAAIADHRCGGFWTLHQPGETAREVYRASLEAARAGSVELILAQSGLALGKLELGAGRYVEALDALEDARAVLERCVHEGLFAFPLAEYGVVLTHLGRREEAQVVLAQALSDARERQDRVAEAYALEAGGSLAAARGDYFEALRGYRHAEQAWTKAAVPVGRAGTLVLRGGVLSEIGRFADAEDAFREALRLLAESEEPVREGYAWIGLGLARLDRGDFPAAEQPLERAARIFEAAAHEAGRAEALHHQGTCALLKGELLAAGRHFLRAAALRERIGDLSGEILSKLAAAEAALRFGDRSDASGLLFEAQLAIREMPTAELRWREEFLRARLEELQGEQEMALEGYGHAAQALEELRSRLTASELRARFLGDKREVYRLACRLAARCGPEEDSFRYAELGKARTLWELGSRNTATSSELVRAEEALRAAEMRLAYGQRTLHQFYDREEREALKSAWEQARVRHALARLRLATAAPERNGWEGVREPATLEEVQAALPPNTALLSYQVGTGGATLWMLRADARRFVELPVTAAELETEVDRLLAPFAGLSAGALDLANLRFEAAAAQRLYAALLRPLGSDLDGVERLIIVRDGVLRRLPFALLVTEWEKRRVDPQLLFAQYAGCRFLIEDYAIRYLPAASLLTLQRSPSGPPESADILALADPAPLPAGATPLPGALRELGLGATLPDDSAPLFGARATEEAFKARAGSAGLLHLASHGELDDWRPAYSRIALAPGGGEDGWLHAYEVEALELQATLVVLSACDTLGTAGRGEGLLGLTRAFLRAGAGSVMAAGWSVDDSATAALVGRFRESYAEGVSAPEALRGAQLALIHAEPREGVAWVHPFFWAGFQIVGAP